MKQLSRWVRIVGGPGSTKVALSGIFNVSLGGSPPRCFKDTAQAQLTSEPGMLTTAWALATGCEALLINEELSSPGESRWEPSRGAVPRGANTDRLTWRELWRAS